MVLESEYFKAHLKTSDSLDLMLSFEINIPQARRSIRRRRLRTRSCISNKANRSDIDSISYVSLGDIGCSSWSFIESSGAAVRSTP